MSYIKPLTYEQLKEHIEFAETYEKIFDRGKPSIARALKILAALNDKNGHKVRMKDISANITDGSSNIAHSLAKLVAGDTVEMEFPEGANKTTYKSDTYFFSRTSEKRYFLTTKGKEIVKYLEERIQKIEFADF